MGEQSSFRFSKHVFFSALLGASLGFGMGVATHALWQFVAEIYARRRFRTNREFISDAMRELTSLKSEVAELRRMLTAVSHRSTLEQSRDELGPLYFSDEEDEYFDVDNADFSSQPLVPTLPQKIMDELDQLATLAMGEYTLETSAPKVFAGGDELRLGSQAYARCLVYRKAYRRSPEFLWRFARATYLASTEANNDDPTTETLNDSEMQNDSLSVSSSSRTLNDMAYELTSRRQFVEHGLTVARRALSLAKSLQDKRLASDIQLESHTFAEIYKWLAVMLGLACEFVGVTQRITYGMEFKELIDKAIEFNPDDPYSHHLRGRWCYQVYNLTWIERTLASRLFATPPIATLEEAVRDFQETEQIRPNFYAANLLYLAKCCISRSDYTAAANWLRKAKDLIDLHRCPAPHVDNLEVQVEIQTLFPKYASYLTAN